MQSILDKGRNSILVSFIVLAMFGGWAIKSSSDRSSGRLYKTQLQTCGRGNVLRGESNDRILSHNVDTRVLSEALRVSMVARMASGSPSDLVAADKYRTLLSTLEKVGDFKKIPIVDCKQVVHKP